MISVSKRNEGKKSRRKRQREEGKRTPHHKVRAGEMREAGRADAAPVRPVGAIADEVDGHLALGRFDCGVGLARGDGVALGEDLWRRDER